MARKTRKIKRKIKRSRRKTRQVKRSRRNTRQVKRSRRKTRQVKRSRRNTRKIKRSRRKTRQVKRSRRNTRQVKRSRRKIKGGAFPVIGLGALALLGAGSVAVKKLMDRSKSPEPNDDMQQRYSDMSSYGTGVRVRYVPPAIDLAIAEKKRWDLEKDTEDERKRNAAAIKNQESHRKNQEKLKRDNRKKAAEERRKAKVAEEAAEEAQEEVKRQRRREMYDLSERKRKQRHMDKEKIRIQALRAAETSRVAASKVKRIPVRPTVFKKVNKMNTQEMQDAAYFRAEDQRIKNEIAARPENALSMNPFY
jgi:hypothetical protein